MWLINTDISFELCQTSLGKKIHLSQDSLNIHIFIEILGKRIFWEVSTPDPGTPEDLATLGRHQGIQSNQWKKEN